MTNLVELTIPQPAETGGDGARSLVEAARVMTVANADQYQGAADTLRGVKSRWAAIEAQRKELARPLDDAKKRLQAFFAVPLGFLEEAEALIKRKMVTFQKEENERVREAQRKADAEARRERERLEERARKAEAAGKAEKAAELAERAQAVVAEVVTPAPTRAAGVATQQRWEFEVTDAKALPSEFTLPDEQKIRRVVQAMKADTNIPGVRVFSSTTLAARGR